MYGDDECAWDINIGRAMESIPQESCTMGYKIEREKK
jgi:hypothetical protein